MSYTNDQWRSAITKLLTLTSKNDLKWELTRIEEGDAWTTIDRSLKAEITGKAYVVSQTRTKYFHDEDDYTWRGGFLFSIYDKDKFDQYEKIATAPEISSISGLFEAAENNMAFNRNALGGLLA
jgi:hypothetical protein